MGADRNSITQSAVSQQINVLEDKLKRRLFERGLAVIHPTEKYSVRPASVIHRSDGNLSLAAKKFLQLLSIN